MFEGFQFPKTMLVWMEAHPAAAGWAQALIAGVAIGAVYYAATMPVRAETKRLEDERAARADGLQLLLLPEILTLQGELEAAVENGTLADPAITVSATLMDRADQMYIMGETGRRLLQALGLINGVAVQTARFHSICDERHVNPTLRPLVGSELWANNVATYKICLVNLAMVVHALTPD